MENFGFIHGELDTKILILYVLRRLPRPVDAQTLAELCSFDNGVSWFDYADCLAGLVDTQHGEAAETSIPYSVRIKANRLLEPVAEKMRRDAMIDTGHENAPGGIITRLSLSDGKGEIISMRLLVPDEDTSEGIEEFFRTDAEGIYQQIIEILTDGMKKE